MKNLIKIATCWLLLLSLFLCVSCVGKGNEDETTNPIQDPEETTSEEKKEMEIKQWNLALNSSNEYVKILGVRNLAATNLINCDWSCSGIEVVVENHGDSITFVVGSDKPCYFRAYVDGKSVLNSANNSYHFEVTGDRQSIKLPNIAEGSHVVRLIKVTGYTLAKAAIYGIKFNGRLLARPADQKLHIEYVGDSISCGYGVLSSNTNDGKYTAQDGSLAYPYMLSSALNADYSITALSGQGLFCGNPGLQEGYRYACKEKNSSQKYAFERKADIVVINIGTNDYYYSVGGGTPHINLTEAQFKEGYYNFIRQVKEANGEDCQILCLYGMMNNTYSAGILGAVSQAGGAQNGVYALSMPASSGGHPHATDHKAYTNTLTEYIQTAILPKIS